MGVQAQPEYASVFVETTPIPISSCAIQTTKEEPSDLFEIAEELVPGLHADMDQSFDLPMSISNPEVRV